MASRKPRGKRAKPQDRKEDQRNSKGCDSKRDDSRKDYRNKPWDNDLSWYAHNPSLLADAANFPFPNRPGMSVPFTSLAGTHKYYIPGVCRISWIPSIGISNNPMDPASILGNEIYSRVRNSFSGDLRADGPDYVMYILALDSVFSYIARLKRIYRAMVAWTPDNRVLPEKLMESMGIHQTTLNNLRANRISFHQCINQLVLMTRKFVCPGDFDYINRHYWMNDNLYTDRASINSQFYLLDQMAYYKFAMLPNTDGVDAPGVQMIPSPLDVGGTPENVTYEQLFNFGLSLITALSEWDEVYTINGYLQRAYEGSPTFVVDELPFDSVLVPVYSEEVLMQIENLTTPPRGFVRGADYSGMSVTQNSKTNSVVANPKFVTKSNADITNDVRFFGELLPYINLRVDQTSPALCVEATRLKTQGSVEVGAQQTDKTYPVTTTITSCASEIPGSIEIFGLTAMQSGVWSYTGMPSTLAMRSNGPAPTMYDLWEMVAVSAFDWHPLMLLLYNDVAGNPTTISVYGDVANLTSISRNDLTNLHTVCLYSLLNSFNS